MSANFTAGIFQAIGPDGPLSGALLYTYVAGTTTPQTTWTSSALTTANSNPVVCDSAGRADVWLDPTLTYRMRLTDADGNPQWDADDIIGTTGGGGAGTSLAFARETFSPAAAAVTVVLQTSTFTPGTASVAVFVDGLYQTPGVDFTEGSNGQVLTFATPFAGTEEVVVLSGRLVTNGFDGAQVGFTQAGTGAVSRSATAKMRETVSVLDFGADPTGVADSTTAIQSAIDAITSGTVLFPRGVYLTSAEITITSAGVTLQGAGGHLKASEIRGSAVTGAVVRFKNRSPGMIGLAVTATSGRYAASTTGGHGVFLGADDSPSGATTSMSRHRFRDVLVENQPTDGIHSRYGCELSDYNQVTATDCKRHGFVFDAGGNSGATNRSIGPFHWTMTNCRAIECGGNGLVVGSLDQAGAESPIDGYFVNFEALGCAWDSAVRLGDYMVMALGQGLIFEMPDFEDQQYAAATTSSTGKARTARATPTSGVFVGGSRAEFRSPYFSSLVASVEFTGGGAGYKVTNPRIFSGTYNVAQSVAFVVPSSVTGFYGEAISALCPGATRVFQNQSASGWYRLDGQEYVGTTASTGDVRVVRNGVANSGAIVSGVAAAPTATLMQYAAEVDTAPIDTVTRITRVVFPDGMILRIVAATGETITYSSGTATAGDNKGLVLGSSTRAITSARELWLAYSAKADVWTEVLYVA